MGREIPLITSHTLTPWEGIHTGITSTSDSRKTNIGRQGKLIFNVWIHW